MTVAVRLTADSRGIATDLAQPAKPIQLHDDGSSGLVRVCAASDCYSHLPQPIPCRPAPSQLLQHPRPPAHGPSTGATRVTQQQSTMARMSLSATLYYVLSLYDFPLAFLMNVTKTTSTALAPPALQSALLQPQGATLLLSWSGGRS